MKDVDVVIMGSGFGGSLCALILDRIGLRTALLDRMRHPRFAIGESSTPAADRILHDLAVRYDLPRLKALTTWGSWQRAYPDVLGGIKRGFSYFAHRPGERFEPRPDHANELLVTASSSDETSDAQWYRAHVDAFFADEVRQSGVHFREDVDALPVFHGGGWEVAGYRAAFFIDATGAGGVLSRALGFDDLPVRTRTRALFSHFTGVRRWAEEVRSAGVRVDDYPFDPDDAALHQLIEGGWMWMIRFKNELLSAGFVLDIDRHPVDASVSPKEEWNQLLGAYPSLSDLFAKSALAPTPGRILRVGRLQRRTGPSAGPSWALLPHTAAFIDPLHSTGIAHTLSGVERLVRSLETDWGALEEPMAGYGVALRREFDFVDRLVSLCYRSIDSFEAWTAATMLYFAAATTYERTRPRGLFLCADDDRLFKVAAEAGHRCADSDFRDWLENALVPYNDVGLFRPDIPNMYAHTAADMG